MDFKKLMANVGLTEESGDPSSMRIMCYGIIACMMFVYIYETITRPDGQSNLSIQEIITIFLALGGKTAQKLIEVKKNENNVITTTSTSPTQP